MQEEDVSTLTLSHRQLCVTMWVLGPHSAGVLLHSTFAECKEPWSFAGALTLSHLPSSQF